jgi:chromosome partitioning protein
MRSPRATEVEGRPSPPCLIGRRCRERDRAPGRSGLSALDDPAQAPAGGDIEHSASAGATDTASTARHPPAVASGPHTPPMRLAVCSSKGGVGKTTMAANLAVALARRGRVLAVDVDPQDSLGRAFGVVAKSGDDSLAGLLEDPSADARAVVRHDVTPGLDLLPSHPSLETAAAHLATTGGLVTSVRRVLRPLVGEYEHVVLDTRGDLGGLTLAAVCAVDAVLTVFTSDPGSAVGVARVAAFLEQQRTYENTSAVLVGVACAVWDQHGRAAREVAGALDGTDLPLLRTRVPLSRRVPTSTLAKRPVVLSHPTSPVATAYLALADEALTAAERVQR